MATCVTVRGSARQLAAIFMQRTCRTLTTSSRSCAPFEPEGLDDGPEIPEYPLMNIQMKGYDFAVLEKYSKYVHNFVTNIGQESTAYPVPARTTHINIFKDKSNKIQHSYDLSLFERTVQVENLPSTIAPLLIDALQLNLPEGVSLSIKEHDPEEEEFRFVPNLEKEKLEAQIDDLNQAREDRKRK